MAACLRPHINRNYVANAATALGYQESQNRVFVRNFARLKRRFRNQRKGSQVPYKRSQFIS
jgi:hypothetical protein